MSKKIIKMRKITMGILAFFIIILGGLSILQDFGLTATTIQLSFLVTMFFSIIVVGEVLAHASWKVATKKAITPFEITALSIVLLALLPSVLGLFDITSQTLNVFAGALKSILIVLGISLIFTKQEGE